MIKQKNQSRLLFKGTCPLRVDITRYRDCTSLSTCPYLRKILIPLREEGETEVSELCHVFK